jgi:hypothetical protein
VEENPISDKLSKRSIVEIDPIHNEARKCQRGHVSCMELLCKVCLGNG